MNDLKQAVQEFFKYLDRVEESDEGREFHPVYISCCSAQWNHDLARILEQMKELSQPVLTEAQEQAAVIWLQAHADHVQKLKLSTVESFPPTLAEDKNNPALWKGGHWNWFFDEPNL